MSLKATYGIMKPASQSGLKLPVHAGAAARRVRRPRTRCCPYDPAKANQLLDAAGYKKGADGKRTNPTARRSQSTFSVQAGFIDYQAMADVVVTGLQRRRASTPRSPPPRRTRSTGRRRPATSR